MAYTEYYLVQVPPSRLESQDGEITITSAKRCWKCHILAESMQRCGRCHHVRYCSKECQKADWSRHRKICRPDSAYDHTKGAIINMEKHPFYTMDMLTPVALHIIETEMVHINNIRYSNIGHVIWEEAVPFLDEQEVRTFLEYGLSPQCIINVCGMDCFNKKTLTEFLEYGSDLKAQPPSSLELVSFLLNYGLKPSELISVELVDKLLDRVQLEFSDDLEVLLHMADMGYDFSCLNSQGENMLKVIEQCVPKVAREIRIRHLHREEIIKTLSDLIPPELGNICMSYYA